MTVIAMILSIGLIWIAAPLWAIARSARRAAAALIFLLLMAVHDRRG